MCPNVLSHGTQDGARSAIRSTEMSGNVIELHSYMYLVTYELFLVTFNLTEWQRFILHPVLGIYHLPNRRYTYMYTILRDSSIQSRIDLV